LVLLVIGGTVIRNSVFETHRTEAIFREVKL